MNLLSPLTASLKPLRKPLSSRVLPFTLPRREPGRPELMDAQFSFRFACNTHVFWVPCDRCKSLIPVSGNATHFVRRLATNVDWHVECSEDFLAKELEEVFG